MLLVLVACASSPVPATVTDTAPAWTDPTTDDDWSALVPEVTVSPSWTAAEVAAQVDAALARGVPGPERPLGTYLELLTHAEAACPGLEQVGGFAMYGVCTASNGYTFSGAAGLIVEDSRAEAPDGTRSGRLYVNTAPADYMILRPDGTRFGAGGTLTLEWVWEGARLGTRSTISGTWFDNGDPSWLEEGFSGSLGLTRQASDDGESRVELDGSLNMGGATLSFARLEIVPARCADGVRTGSLSVRHPDTSWYTLRFTESCSPCAEVTWQDGSPLGTACIDAAPLLAAVQPPRLPL